MPRAKLNLSPRTVGAGSPVADIALVAGQLDGLVDDIAAAAATATQGAQQAGAALTQATQATAQAGAAVHRANHDGTQLASTISDLPAAVKALLNAETANVKPLEALGITVGRDAAGLPVLNFSDAALRALIQLVAGGAGAPAVVATASVAGGPASNLVPLNGNDSVQFSVSVPTGVQITAGAWVIVSGAPETYWAGGAHFLNTDNSPILQGISTPNSGPPIVAVYNYTDANGVFRSSNLVIVVKGS